MMLEAFVHLAAWLETVSSDFGKWFLVSKVIKFNFYGFVLSGAQVELKISVSPAPG